MKRVMPAVGEGDVGVSRAPLLDDLMDIDDLRLPVRVRGRQRRTPRRRRCRREVRFDDGEELFHEGEPADAWWVLVDGRVELVRRADARKLSSDDDGAARCLGRRVPSVGRREQLPRHGSRLRLGTHVPGAVDGTRRARTRLVPLRRAPDRRLLPEGPPHGHDVAPTRVTHRAR